MSKAKRINGKRVSRPEKIGLLYLFLIPMFVSVVQSLFRSDYGGFILKGLGFLLLYGVITLANKGWKQKTLYTQSTLIRAPKVPFLKLAAFGLGITAFYLSFFIGGKTLFPSLFVGILTPLGFYLYYGFDPTKDKLSSIDGISAQLVLDTIKEANQKLAAIRSDMKNIADESLQEALTVATQKADTILTTIQEDPKDIRVARKFLIVYIDGIAKVTNAYTQIDEKEISTKTKQKLYTLMEEVEQRFTAELQRLKENNHFDLDVHIDVLKEQIKH